MLLLRQEPGIRRSPSEQDPKVVLLLLVVVVLLVVLLLTLLIVEWPSTTIGVLVLWCMLAAAMKRIRDDRCCSWSEKNAIMSAILSSTS